jgi:outer membrane murein-binding lipoprotein Lpp
MAHQAADTVTLTKAIADWLVEAGVADAKQRADISVDLADLIAAARQVEADVKSLVQQRPATASEADKALALATDIEVQLFTELSSHLDSLRRAWPKLLERLDAMASPT